MNKKEAESMINTLFSGSKNIYSLLWWDDPTGHDVKVRSFIVNGRESIPIFSSDAEARKQLAGSEYEKELVSIEPSLLAGILQKKEYTVLNPGNKEFIQFKSRYLKKYMEKKESIA